MQGIGMINSKAMNNERLLPPPPPPPPAGNKEMAQREQCLSCPRCNSTNTKFCYYNNYSLSQPRHYCKTCRRYWTQGGSLRNIPIGGSSRKNKRPGPTPPSLPPPPPPSSIMSPNKKYFTDGHQNPSFTPTTSSSAHASRDLGFAYPSTQNYNHATVHPNNTPSTFGYNRASVSHGCHNTNPGTNEFAPIGLNGFLPVSGSGPRAGFYYAPGFGGFQESMPLSFPLDGGFDGSSGFGVQVEENGPGNGASCKPLFPFEDLKQPASSSAHGGDPNALGSWNNKLGGGWSW